jgi:hypothetical protein
MQRVGCVYAVKFMKGIIRVFDIPPVFDVSVIDWSEAGDALCLVLFLHDWFVTGKPQRKIRIAAMHDV